LTGLRGDKGECQKGKKGAKIDRVKRKCGEKVVETTKKKNSSLGGPDEKSNEIRHVKTTESARVYWDRGLREVSRDYWGGKGVKRY